MIPEYWTGISHPPKSTSFAPRARCTVLSGVARSGAAAAMKPQASIRHFAGRPRQRRDALRGDREGRPVYRGSVKSRRVKRLKAVSNSKDSFDVLVRVGAQFLAQPADVHVQRARADLGS